MYSFKDVEWGPDEAKGDSRLLKYFYPITGFDELIRGTKRYVVGRKGTGKTAICERIRLEADPSKGKFAIDLSLRGFPINAFRTFLNPNFSEKSRYVSVWGFLIRAEFARLLLQDQAIKNSDEGKDLMNFLDTNFSMNPMAQMLETLSAQKGILIAKKKWIAKDNNENINVSVNYETCSDWLMKTLHRMRSDGYYFLLMDELDEGYNTANSQLGLALLALLRATEDFCIATQGSKCHFRPILVLRSDIYEHLQDNDLNKLDDATIRLRWSSSPQATYSLHSIVRARIDASINLTTGVHPWDAIVIDRSPDLPTKVGSVWAYICNRTFERPRDIIKFMKFCKINAGNGPMTFQIVKEAENDYSRWFYDELRDEIQAHLPIWAETLACFTNIGRGVMTVQMLEEELLKSNRIRDWLQANRKTTNDIISMLFNFGLLGNLMRNTTWLFKYKDLSLEWNPEARLILHYGFHKKLKIKPRL